MSAHDPDPSAAESPSGSPDSSHDSQVLMSRGPPALPGRPPGREGWSGAVASDGLPTFLGWFSVGLGLLELLAPHAVARAIGVRPSATWTGVLRLHGARELANGAGILRNPQSKEWVGMRVGGDMLDLVTLGLAATQTVRPARTLLASAFVLGATMLDIIGTERLAERRKARTLADSRAPEPVVVRSVTVGRPVDEVYRFWRQFENFPRFMEHIQAVETLADGTSRWRATGPGGTEVEWTSEFVEERENERLSWRSVAKSDVYNAGTVTFRPAPRDEGTVVTVEIRYAPPGGRMAAALLKVFRKEPGQQVGDDLRRFKQIMELGEVVCSDASAQPGVAAARPHESPGERTVH